MKSKQAGLNELRFKQPRGPADRSSEPPPHLKCRAHTHHCLQPHTGPEGHMEGSCNHTGLLGRRFHSPSTIVYTIKETLC